MEPGRPVPLLELTAQFLESANVDAQMSFPGQLKQYFTQVRVCFPVTVDDRKLHLVQGLSAGKAIVNLYFDDQTGLLVGAARFTEAPLGQSPQQVDYGNYRDVAGVKMPFRITSTWLDGKAVTELTQIQPNVPIDAARFGNPGPPAPPE